MRHVLFFLLLIAAVRCTYTGTRTLLSEVEEKPTTVRLDDLRAGRVGARWIRIENPRVSWSKVAFSKKRSGGYTYYVPMAGTDAIVADALGRKKLDAVSILAIAMIDAETAARDFGVIGTEISLKNAKVVAEYTGLRRSFDDIPEVAAELLKSSYRGIEEHPVIEIGAKPAGKGDGAADLAFGLILGAVWFLWLKRMRKAEGETPEGRARRSLFALFAMMGKVAKADGRVSPAEIAAVEQIFEINEVIPANRKALIRRFKKAKDDDRDVIAYARDFAEAEPDPAQRVWAFRLLGAVARADGSADSAQIRMLESIAEPLGIEAGMLESIRTPEEGPSPSLDESYRLLGCSPQASDEEVKRSYLEQMRKFHPDKIHGKDLPEEFSLYATEQTRKLQAAFEAIRRARGE